MGEDGVVDTEKLRGTNRHLRQLDFINPDAHQAPIRIIGAGSVGSFLTLSLAKMGLRDIEIWDSDLIENHNISNTCYPSTSRGSGKATSLHTLIHHHADVHINTHNYRYAPGISPPLQGIVISAVDSINIRRNLWRAIGAQSTITHYIDTRMGGELLRIYPIDMSSTESREYYKQSLDTANNAPADLPCTGRTFIPTVMITAGLTTELVKKILRKEELPRELIFNLNQFEFYHVRAEESGKSKRSRNREKIAPALAQASI